MPSFVFLSEAYGRTIEIGCYGFGHDWVCRLTDPLSREESQNSIWHPPPDLGFLWLRKSGSGVWHASGLVNREVFRDSYTVDVLIDQIMREAIHEDEQVTRCIEFTEANFTVIANGEEGSVQFPSNWQESRWWQNQ